MLRRCYDLLWFGREALLGPQALFRGRVELLTSALSIHCVPAYAILVVLELAQCQRSDTGLVLERTQQQG